MDRGPQRGRKVGVEFNCRVDESLYDALRARAALEDRPLASVVRQALRYYLKLDEEVRHAS